ncbi:hypothetical protein JZU46_06925 [bacterium]|nr:hypothetical protein [bacterium]
MACGACSHNSRNANRVTEESKELFGEYKYLSNSQIEARLLTYKRQNCPDCNDRYVCNYAFFLKCKKGE